MFVVPEQSLSHTAVGKEQRRGKKNHNYVDDVFISIMWWVICCVYQEEPIKRWLLAFVLFTLHPPVAQAFFFIKALTGVSFVAR